MAIIKIPDEVPPADRNKTDITLEVTEAAARWLHGMGAKAIETEVPICEKWVADLAAIWSPTRTEAKNNKLIPFTYLSCHQPPKGLIPWPKCDFEGNDEKREAMFDEYHKKVSNWQAANPDLFEEAYRKMPGIITIVHEVKTSRADFKRDHKWKMPAQAEVMILSYTTGILSIDEIPAGWWALEHDPKTGAAKGMRRRVWPLHTIEAEAKMWTVAAIAERRHNRTALHFWNSLMKRNRSKDNG